MIFRSQPSASVASLKPGVRYAEHVGTSHSSHAIVCVSGVLVSGIVTPIVPSGVLKLSTLACAAPMPGSSADAELDIELDASLEVSLEAGASVEGASVAGASVAGASVAGASVAGASVPGAAVVAAVESSSSSPQAARTSEPAKITAANLRY